MPQGLLLYTMESLWAAGPTWSTRDPTSEPRGPFHPVRPPVVRDGAPTECRGPGGPGTLLQELSVSFHAAGPHVVHVGPLPGCRNPLGSRGAHFGNQGSFHDM